MEAIEHLRSHDVIAGGQVSNESQTHGLMLKHRPRNSTLSSSCSLLLVTGFSASSAYWSNRRLADVF